MRSEIKPSRNVFILQVYHNTCYDECYTFTHMAEAAHQRWLILVHQLPPRPSNLRVRVWRRLQQVGAVVLRNSLYVLPSTDEGREDFQWVREEVVSSGGEVSVFEANAIDGYSDDELEQQFRDARNADFQTLTAELRAAQGRGQKSGSVRRGKAVTRELARFRERLTAIQAI